MHVKTMRVFCDVVGRRSFSRAADENGISQSGASQMVHQLEHYLGVKLIDRSKRPFVLTPEGEVYYTGCRKLVQRLDALEEEVRSLHRQVVGRVSVASIYSVGLSHMKDFVQRFRRRYPKATVHLEYHHPRRIYELVKTDQIEVGLVSYPKASRWITVTPWRKEPMVVVCAPQHPLAACSTVRLEQLGGLDLVGFDNELQIRQAIDRTLAAHHVEVNVVMEFDNIEMLKRAIEINDGISLLPAPTVVNEVRAGTLISRPLEDLSLHRPVGIIRRRGAELGKTARRFIAHLRRGANDGLEVPDGDDAEPEPMAAAAAAPKDPARSKRSE
jgi:DNA-binding transcriptional LysR family regulator